MLTTKNRHFHWALFFWFDDEEQTISLGALLLVCSPMRVGTCRGVEKVWRVSSMHLSVVKANKTLW